MSEQDFTVVYEDLGYYKVPVGTVYLNPSEMRRMANLLRDTGNDSAADWLDDEMTRLGL